MKAEDLKKAYFGPFVKWLEGRKIGDHFSMDVWMSGVFSLMYAEFQKEMQAKIDNQKLEQFVLKQPIDKLKEIVKQKEEVEKKAKENQAKMKLVDKDGKQTTKDGE